MFEYIRGKVQRREKDEWILETGGLAFRLRVTPFVKPVEEGEERCLLVRSFLKESGEFVFYGFEDEEERKIFDSLREVRGINHRTAFKILSRLHWKEFVRCVLEEDTHTLEERGGISTKTARRLIVELRPILLEAGFTTPSPYNAVFEEAREVLLRLGYTPQEVNPVMARLLREFDRRNIDVEEVIKQALVRLGGRG
ncbi:MAG: Holliday junction branch migration protein RuvA [Atribacterota bacterium]